MGEFLLFREIVVDITKPTVLLQTSCLYLNGSLNLGQCLHIDRKSFFVVQKKGGWMVLLPSVLRHQAGHDWRQRAELLGITALPTNTTFNFNFWRNGWHLYRD